MKRKLVKVELVKRRRERAAVYIRVSTESQSAENQRDAIEQVIATRRLELERHWEETASTSRARPKFDAMMVEARRGAFDVLIVWALDRFGRSMAGNVAALLELDRLGVQIVSVQEPWLDTGGPVRALLIAVFSWVAEQERVRLGERTRAGIDRARARGVRLGRPPSLTRGQIKQARRLQRKDISVRDIARELRASSSAVYRALKGEKNGG